MDLSWYNKKPKHWWETWPQLLTRWGEALLKWFAHEQQMSKYAPLKSFLVRLEGIMKISGRPSGHVENASRRWEKTLVQTDDPWDSWTKGRNYAN